MAKIPKTCPDCNGKGYKLIDGEKCSCSRCAGFGCLLNTHTEGEYEHMAKAKGLMPNNLKWFDLERDTQATLRAKCKPFFSVDEGF